MFTFVNNDWYTPDATTKRQAAEMPVQTSKKPKIISTSNNAMDEDMRNEAEIASLLAAINLQQPEALQSGQVIYCIEIEITIFALRGLPKTDRELYTMLAPASEAGRRLELLRGACEVGDEESSRLSSILQAKDH
ncbi:MAG: hypothetical protein LQ338_001756 [Usnochroma carphineum]|nr:MAG: hypothetical protein LQ338_001756 [Usnochroma carphineum]